MQDYVLAMYDIQGKQNFIYRSNKLREIEGASKLLGKCYKKYLFPAAKEYRNELYAITDKGEAIYSEDNRFCFSKFEEKMKGNQYIGEVLYEGGGNFLILYKNADICKEINYRFSKKLIEETGSLSVICTFINNLDPNHFHGKGDNKGDYERLYDKHRKEENKEPSSVPYGTVPFVMHEAKSSQPIIEIVMDFESGRMIELTQESKVKRYSSDVSGEKDLDKLLEDDDDSLLAVIYADGNNMGKRVQSTIDGKETIDDCVNSLREFSKKIQETYVEPAKKLVQDGEKTNTVRLVISAGDEVTIICDASHAFSIAKDYLDSLPERETSCAGIAIFKSHAPYDDAYRIAEECCESGKKMMRERGEEEACYIDFHYCQGAIGVGLKEIRNEEGTLGFTSLPWRIKGKKDEHCDIEKVRKMIASLDELGQSNRKGLLEPAKKSDLDLSMEMKRIFAHMPKSKRQEMRDKGLYVEVEDYVNNRNIVFDIMRVYDIWFKEKANEKGKN